MNIEEAVRRAIEQDAEWRKTAGGEFHPNRPRVFVKIGETLVLRRPFRRRGRDGKVEWVVRWHGIARLASPKIEAGNIVFKADWS